MSKYKYITIEREYGSGGTKIAAAVSEICGIPCYGREILEKTAEKYHVSPEEIDRYEESVTGSLLYTLFMLGKAQSGDSETLTNEGKVFLAEQKVITELAAEGPAIFVGHCASEALRNKSGVLHVFIRSATADKRTRILEDYHIPASEADATMRRYDKKRSNYYFINTARRWTDNDNYDLILDSGKLKIPGCAAAIAGIWKQ